MSIHQQQVEQQEVQILEQEAREYSDRKAVVESPHFQAAFDSMEKEILDRMTLVDWGDTNLNSQLVKAFKIFRGIKDSLHKRVEDAEYAKLKLEDPWYRQFKK
jgi:hypothetical protein